MRALASIQIREHVKIISRATRGIRLFTFYIAGILGLIATAFVGSSLGAEPSSVPLPHKDLATPTLETAEMNVSQSACWNGVNEWMEKNLFRAGTAPFSFVYDGKSSDEFLADWDFTATKTQLANTGTQHVLTYVDKKTGLEVRCEAVVFKDFPAVEWVVKFRNTSDRETPIIADIQALDTTLTDPNNDFTLFGASGVGEGASAQAEDFGPWCRPLPFNKDAFGVKIHPAYGRSAWGRSLPFFNVEMSNHGVILAIGWTGQWLADFARNEESLSVRAGMELTHLKLYPGEEIRTPKIMLLFWQGHRLYGQNLLRRTLLAHYWPKDRNGEPVNLMFSGGPPHLKDFGEQDVIKIVGEWAALGVEYLWVDAWWWNPLGPVTHIGPPDSKRFPRGLKPISDALKKHRMGLIVWFCPECPENGLANYGVKPGEHPEWLLRTPFDGKTLFNFADDNARIWMTNHICSLIKSEGISVFRQDGPYGDEFQWKQPLQWWRDADEPNRKGITEIRYIEGLYTFWDELLKRNPGLVIDLCGGGASRLDIEVLSRCVILHRSDYRYGESIGQQAQNYGISQWIPAAGTGAGVRASAAKSVYGYRSAFHNGVVLAYVSPIPKHAVRMIDEFKRIRHLFLGDFYPLTPYSTFNDDWIAYQFHREDDLHQGMLLAFRRPKCVAETATLKLWGLSPDASYEVHFEDSGVKQAFTGKKLAEGLNVTIENQPGSLLITYRQLP